MISLIITFLSYFVIRALSDEAVHTLDYSNFDEFIKTNPKVLVEFYAPWCGHCKALAPEYEKAAEKIHKESSQARLAKIDASDEKNKPIATKYGIRGFPTLKFFSNGDVDHPIDYSGGRTEDTIVSWIQKRSLPAVSKLNSKQEIEDFKKKARLVLLGYLKEDSDEYSALAEAAENFRESVVIGVVSDESLATDGAKAGDLWIHREFDTPSVKYNGAHPFDAKSIGKFINDERFALIDAIGPENYKDYMDRGLPLVWIALDASKEENINTLISTLTPYATEWKGKLSFTWIDAVKYEQHVKNLGLTTTPGMLIVAENGKYLFHGSLDSADDVKSYFSQYGAGTLEPFLRSQPIPESDNEPVKTLVGKSFTDTIGKDKDVFVEFYAPWCGHCKRLAPEFDKVGTAFADVNSMVIAKIDATENDTPEEIKGFPTLIFYPKNSKTGVKYNGDRTAKAIVDWLKGKASGDVSSVKSEL